MRLGKHIFEEFQLKQMYPFEMELVSMPITINTCMRFESMLHNQHAYFLRQSCFKARAPRVLCLKLTFFTSSRRAVSMNPPQPVALLLRKMNKKSTQNPKHSLVEFENPNSTTSAALSCRCCAGFCDCKDNLLAASLETAHCSCWGMRWHLLP